jgi:PAS domain S-box-containing protein
MPRATNASPPAQSQDDDRLLWAEEAARTIARGVTGYAVVVLDKECRILSWNVGAGRMLGFSAERMVGQKFFDRFYPAERLACN